MDCIIRPAEKRDAADMVALLNPIIAAGIYTAMNEPVTLTDQLEFVHTFPARGVFLVAVHPDTGQIMGMQDVVPLSDESAWRHVGAISTFVALNAQRQGIGAQLCAAMFEAARAKGFRKLSATIRADNPHAVAFYLRQGFRLIGTAQQHALIRGRYVDEVLAERLLG